MKWQPIGEAPVPKDDMVYNRIYVLLWGIGFDRPSIGWPTVHNGWMDEDGDECEPTHWMPLPESPEVE
ncbi:DUF551 domain-containing protein [Dyella sp. SG609]|uniref:DUF551 domain-containing protein n=1 Tax=Dyella sp. SG609 TaxID=2587018 RepID=UPI0014471FCA|nr:DUF551 domain-containing protein [Dyella sp. SG609]NKJ21965.1 hypothetical protein [Dyella sp. SG609]